ncbi:MAG: NADH-quinone oxidoreductase subunit L, partial [Moraxellaceae bacterium]|nr:NADH-quinone oxidoreductase subunit L [Moraxellaceae bacterium]
MDLIHLLYLIAMLAPVGLMLIAVLVMRPGMSGTGTNLMWRRFSVLSVGALLCAGAALALQAGGLAGEAGTGVLLPWLSSSRTGSVLAILVQLLGTVIAAFSARYLQGEPRQQRYIAALAGVLACVHLLLLANHWLVLIGAWASVGIALQPLLCFYPDRPFALLAAHKKRIADRMADVLLLVAAVLAWQEVGSGSLTDLWQHLATHDTSIALQISALCLVLAVVLRTALLPVHGWLTQVMEAPTPVSALLHAGVVNLGGYVLIRFAPLLEASLLARIVLVGFGLATALLAGLVMLTRVSIKVRLAWSTVAQMGFMVLQCGLGLYTLAALHLIGHSLYKAHTFLSASTAVRDSKRQMMHLRLTPSVSSLIAAPFLTIVLIVLVQALAGTSWPWWWSG